MFGPPGRLDGKEDSSISLSLADTGTSDGCSCLSPLLLLLLLPPRTSHVLLNTLLNTLPLPSTFYPTSQARQYQSGASSYCKVVIICLPMDGYLKTQLNTSWLLGLVSTNCSQTQSINRESEKDTETKRQRPVQLAAVQQQ